MTNEVEMNQCSAALRITSTELSPVDITELLGIEPSEAVEPGVKIRPGRRAMSREHTTWILDSGLDRSNPLDRHISALLDLVKQRVPQLQELSSKNAIDLYCDIAIFGGQGRVALSRELLAQTAELGADFLLSVYCIDAK